MNFSPFINNCVSIAGGIGSGYYINCTIEREAAIRQGRNHNLAGSLQSEQVNMALYQVLGLLDWAGTPITNTVLLTKNIVALSPYGLAYIANRQDLGLRTRRILNFVQDHIGALSLTITLATTSIFLLLGHTLFASSTIVFLGIGLLDRRGYLPPSLRNLINRTGFIVSNVNNYLFADSLTRLFSVINLIGYAVDLYFKYRISKIDLKKNILTKHPAIPPTTVNTKMLEKLDDLVVLNVNKGHVNKEFLPPIDPEINLNDLLDMSDSIDWNKHQSVLIKKLNSDPRWREVGVLQNKTPIDYFKENLRTFISSIKEHKIREGQPDSYVKLEKYCRFITQELKKCDEITKVDALLEMGVGGDYCGSAKFRIIEERVSLMILNAEGLPLDKRVLATLQQERVMIWQKIYSYLWNTIPIAQLDGMLRDTNDIHNHNVMLNLSGMGEECGIPHEGAINDRTAEIPPCLHYLGVGFRSVLKNSFWGSTKTKIRQCYFKKVRNLPPEDNWKIWKWFKLYNKRITLKRSYTVDTIIKTVSDNIGAKDCIPKPQVYEWWIEWIKRQNLDAAASEKLFEGLASKNPVLFGEPFEVEGKIQPKFIKAMLLEMGVLTL